MTREEAIKIIDCYDIGFYDLSGAKIPADKMADAFDMAIEALLDRPTVDSVEVVRCKDCKYSDIAINPKDHIRLQCVKKIIDNPILFDYCSYGERKEEE